MATMNLLNSDVDSADERHVTMMCFYVNALWLACRQVVP